MYCSRAPTVMPFTRISPRTGNEMVPASERRIFSRFRSSSPSTRMVIMSPEPSL